jgi:putative PEP-CTERM system histidine kinase
LEHELNSLVADLQTSFLGNIGLYSYGTTLGAFLLLTMFAVLTRRNNSLGNSLIIGSGMTVIWAGTITLSTLLPEPLTSLIYFTEILRNAAWSLLLLKLLASRMEVADNKQSISLWKKCVGAAYLASLVLVFSAELIVEKSGLSILAISNIQFASWLGLAVLGLLLIEQFFRNSNEGELWATKHLCIALGMIFIYDFFMYAEALLLQHLDQTFWQARGVVITMAAVPMAISMGRLRRNQDAAPARSFHLSRHVAFHSLTLMAAGFYLIGMAIAAYFIRYLGGSWGGLLQITFLCAAGLLLVVLLFSGQIRSRTRVWLSKNFFSYKYDYRVEWLQFTQKLVSGSNDVPLSITVAIADLAKSPGGILWGRTSSGHLSTLTHWEMAHPGSDANLEAIAHWLEENEWIIDLQEWRRSPDVYSNLELPKALTEIPKARLLIPLLYGEKAQGILLLKESEHVHELNWEDRDLLKVAGRQAASHLAQYQADQALVESRQFEAFNRLAAYVIHDLKNILAQLSLTVANAQKHKHNPEFIDDMIGTVDNSVNRMTKLMTQLRSGTEFADQQEIELSSLLKTVVNEAGLRQPAPELVDNEQYCVVNCDSERLHSVFGHLIHNAQDATDKNGRISVRLETQPGYASIEIEDNGKGMEESFIQHRLFKPFDSTKGLTGMGIGAFESRDFIRNLGGEILVQSTVGEGSKFTVRIPIQQSH